MAKDKFCKSCGAALVWTVWEPNCVCEFCGTGTSDRFLSLICEVTSALGLDGDGIYDLSKAQCLTEQMAAISPTHYAVYAMTILRLLEPAYDENYVENGRRKNQLLFETVQAFLSTQEGKSEPEFASDIEAWVIDALAYETVILHMAVCACDHELVRLLIQNEAETQKKCSMAGEEPVDIFERLEILKRGDPIRGEQFSAIQVLLTQKGGPQLGRNSPCATVPTPPQAQVQCSVSLTRKSRIPVFPIKAYFDGVLVGELKGGQAISLDTQAGKHCVEGRYLVQHGINHVNITKNTVIKIDFNALGLLKVTVI